MNIFARIPILKIVIPFVVGILATFFYVPSYTILIAILAFCCLAQFILNHYATPIIRISQNHFLSIPLFILFIALGGICAKIHTPLELPTLNFEKSTAIARIERITHNDFSMSAHVNVIQHFDSCDNSSHINRKMTAWIQGNNYDLKEGSIIIFKFSPQRISNSGNPEEFDYAFYQRNKGILYHLFIKQNEYQIIGNKHSFISFSRSIQQKIIEFIHNSSLTPQAKAFFCTIIMGDSTYLDNNTRENFSYAGVSHILALSGLHVCIISFIISIILFPLDYFKLKKLRFFITIVLLIIFSIVIGLPSSVMRACVMICFVLFAHILHRKNTSLNALFASALVILLVSPFSLFEIGFQLSFISVFLILILSDKLTIISPKQEILYYFYSLVIISLISSIGTMIFTAYYFNYISVISLFSNLLIVPILPIILGIGIIYTLLLCLGFDIDFITDILNKSYQLIVDISSGFIVIPYSHISNIYISPSMLILGIISIISVIFFIMHKRKRFYFIVVITSFASMIMLNFIEHTKSPDSGYAILHDFKSSAILSLHNNHAELLFCNDSINIADFKFKHRAFLAKYHISNLHTNHITSDTTLILGNYKVAIIASNKAKKTIHTPKINVDLLYITKDYYGDIANLLQNYTPKRIVLSANIHHEREANLINECNKLNIPYHSISSQGAIYAFYSTQ